MRAIVAVVALGLLAGCGGGDDGGAEDDGEARAQSRATETTEKAAEKPKPKPTPEEQIEAMLDKRAAALQGGKPGAYVATSIPARRKLDRRVARIASRLKLHKVWYEAGG